MVTNKLVRTTGFLKPNIVFQRSLNKEVALLAKEELELAYHNESVF
jgi:hypothetical protein